MRYARFAVRRWLLLRRWRDDADDDDLTTPNSVHGCGGRSCKYGRYVSQIMLRSQNASL